MSVVAADEARAERSWNRQFSETRIEIESPRRKNQNTGGSQSVKRQNADICRLEPTREVEAEITWFKRTETT